MRNYKNTQPSFSIIKAKTSDCVLIHTSKIQIPEIVCVCMCTCVCAHTCVCPCVCAHAWVHMHVCTCVYVPMCVCTCAGGPTGGCGTRCRFCWWWDPRCSSRAPGLPTGRRLGRWFNGFGSQRRIHYSGRSSAPWRTEVRVGRPRSSIRILLVASGPHYAPGRLP